MGESHRQAQNDSLLVLTKSPIKGFFNTLKLEIKVYERVRVYMESHSKKAFLQTLSQFINSSTIFHYQSHFYFYINSGSSTAFHFSILYFLSSIKFSIFYFLSSLHFISKPAMTVSVLKTLNPSCKLSISFYR